MQQQQERQGEMRILRLPKQNPVVDVLTVTATVTHQKETFLLQNGVYQEHAYKYNPPFVCIYGLDENTQSRIFSLTYN